MDPITQGALGAAWAQAGGGGRPRQRFALIRDATVLGALSGMAPDLDVLIQSPRDPLLFLEYHRHFTHALAFVPVGALLCAAGLHWLVRRRLKFRETYLFCLLGYASHGLLDACTTYGTQLLWPFSSERVAWHVVSVVDPFFTLPLMLLVAAAWYWRRRALAWAGLVWGVAYLSAGAVLNQRAETLGWELAAARGHTPVRLEAKPSFANLVLWKIRASRPWTWSGSAGSPTTISRRIRHAPGTSSTSATRYCRTRSGRCGASGSIPARPGTPMWIISPIATRHRRRESSCCR